jgi:hypothetical protein
MEEHDDGSSKSPNFLKFNEVEFGGISPARNHDKITFLREKPSRNDPSVSTNNEQHIISG